jgi:hypothetical protein
MSHASVKGKFIHKESRTFGRCSKELCGKLMLRLKRFHLDRYLDEQVYRFNHRKDADGQKLTDADRIHLALPAIVGQRLAFAEVTSR